MAMEHTQRGTAHDRRTESRERRIGRDVEHPHGSSRHRPIVANRGPFDLVHPTRSPSRGGTRRVNQVERAAICDNRAVARATVRVLYVATYAAFAAFGASIVGCPALSVLHGHAPFVPDCLAGGVVSR